MRKTRRSALAKQTLFGSGVTLWGERDFAVFKRFGKVHVSMDDEKMPDDGGKEDVSSSGLDVPKSNENKASSTSVQSVPNVNNTDKQSNTPVITNEKTSESSKATTPAAPTKPSTPATSTTPATPAPEVKPEPNTANDHAPKPGESK